MAFLRFSCSAERRRLCCFSAVDDGAGMRFSVAVTDLIAAPNAAIGMGRTPSRATTFDTFNGRSAADCGILASGIVAPRH